MQIFFYVLGAITWVGAIQGARAGSKASLIAGGILGTLILLGAYLAVGNASLGWGLALVGSLGIAGKFVPALIKKRTGIWPGGVLAILSVVGVALAIASLLKH